MLAKLRSVADSMFPVAFVEKESEQIVPFTYATYRPVTVTVVTSKTQTGTINGVPQYRYTTARRTYYEPDETITTSEPVNVAAYTPVVVSVPIYSGGRITGTRSETYYEQNEDLFYMSVFITVSAKTYEELLWRKQQMVDMLKSMDMYTSECSFQQEAALQSVMPFLKISPKLEKKAQRNVLTSGAASSYIFTSFELSDDNGVLLGINRYNNSLSDRREKHGAGVCHGAEAG